MLFFGKKKEEKEACTCGDACTANDVQGDDGEKAARVKVLGTGCAKCNVLKAATKEALVELGMNPAIEHVTDFAQIATYGVMSTPALVVDGKVVSYGKVLKKEEIIGLLHPCH